MSTPNCHRKCESDIQDGNNDTNAGGMLHSNVSKQLNNLSANDLDKSNSAAGMYESRKIYRVKSIAIALFVLHMHNKKMFDFEDEGKSDGARYPHWCHSVANITMYKVITHSCVRFYHFRDNSISNFVT